MSSKTAVVFSCAHVDPSISNDRFDLLGELIYDVNPTYVIDLGDGADMKSLNSFDTRYPEAIVSQNYGEDIEHYNEAMDRLRKKPGLRKYKKPYWIGFEGNHENRIKKALAHDPRLKGDKYGISFGHLSLTTMVSHMLISFLVVTMGQLCLAFTMVIASSRVETILLPVVIVTSVLSTLKILHILIQLSAWLRVASKEDRKVGLGSLT